MERRRNAIIWLLTSFLVLGGIGVGAKAVQTQDKDRGWLGVSVQETSRETRKKLELDRGEGIEVGYVVDDSPADFADLETGDVILSVDGTELKSPRHFSRLIRKKAPGDNVTMAVIHDGNPKTLKIELASHDERTADRPGFFSNRDLLNVYTFGSGLRSGTPYLGVHIQEMSDDLAKYFKVDPQDGVLITDVEEDSPADVAGLKAGDIFVAIAGEQVESTADVMDILRDYDEGDELELTVIRSGNEHKFKATVEEPKGLSRGGIFRLGPDRNFESLHHSPLKDGIKLHLNNRINDHINLIIRREIEGAQHHKRREIQRALENLRFEFDVRPEMNRLREHLRSLEWDRDHKNTIEIDSDKPRFHKKSDSKAI